jgi:hypothetical protein
MKPRVFVSRSAVLTGEQSTVYHRWLDHLLALGFDPFALTRADYEPVPWEQLREAITEADGALVLGFRQLNVKQSWWRPSTAEMTPWSGWLATPWNQVEAALAIMALVPVLVVPEAGVTEGVFSSHICGGELHRVDLDADLPPDKLIGDPGISDEAAPSLRAVMAWAHQVRTQASAARPRRGRAQD